MLLKIYENPRLIQTLSDEIIDIFSSLLFFPLFHSQASHPHYEDVMEGRKTKRKCTKSLFTLVKYLFVPFIFSNSPSDKRSKAEQSNEISLFARSKNKNKKKTERNSTLIFNKAIYI